MHLTKSEVLHRVYGAWSRLRDANQPVWCTQLPVLIPHLELLHRPNRHDSTADKHCVPVMHHTQSLNAFDEVLHRVYDASQAHSACQRWNHACLSCAGAPGGESEPVVGCTKPAD